MYRSLKTYRLRSRPEQRVGVLTLLRAASSLGERFRYADWLAPMKVYPRNIGDVLRRMVDDLSELGFDSDHVVSIYSRNNSTYYIRGDRFDEALQAAEHRFPDPINSPIANLPKKPSPPRFGDTMEPTLERLLEYLAGRPGGRWYGFGGLRGVSDRFRGAFRGLFGALG